MLKTNLIAAALALGLVACGTPGHRQDKDLMPRTPDACKVHVHLDNRNKIFVDQEPTRTGRCAATRVVNFVLLGAPQASAFEIAVKSGPQPRPACAPVTTSHGQPKEYECRFAAPPSGPGQEFPYSIKVVDGGTTITLDPMMIND